MSLNLIVVVAAVLIGIVSAVAVINGMRTKREWPALWDGMLIAIGLSVLALLGVVVVFGSDIFAAAHLLYVILTVGAPIAGLLVIVRTHRTGTPSRLLLVGLVLLAPVGFYATHIEPFWLRIDVVAVPTDTAVDVRVGVLSDLQTDSIGTYEDGAVDSLLDRQLDIVLIPGDLWQMPQEEFAESAPEFTALINRICGQVRHVFLVQGNTDNLDGLRQITAGTTAIVLDDEVVDVTVRGSLVRVLGVTYGGDAARFEVARAAFRESAPEEEPMRIVLAHQPDEIYRFASDDPIDLLVAGHTHGGQIAVPFVGPLVTLSSVPRSVAAGGLHEVEGHPIYVSTGVGRERHNAPQVRFGVRPSIGILELGAANGRT